MANDGKFDTLKVTGNAQVDSLIVGERKKTQLSQPQTQTDPPNMGEPGDAHATSLSIGANILTKKGTHVTTTSDEDEVIIKSNSIQAKKTSYLVSKNEAISQGLLNSDLILQPEGGNIGIGTSKPGMPLHVSSADNPLMLLQSTKGGAGNTANLNFQTYGAAGSTPSPTATISAIDDGQYSSHLAFLTKKPGQDNNPQSEKMRITCDGKVGIGTNPTEKLDIKGGVLLLRDDSGKERFRVNSWSTDLIITDKNGKAALVFDGGSGHLQLKSGGSLILHDPEGKERIRFNSWSNDFIITDKNGKAAFVLDGGSGHLQLKSGGSLILHDPEGKERIRFNSWSNDFIITDKNGKQALIFDGNSGDLSLTGDIKLVGGDCAEEFEIAEPDKAEPGAVMVISEDGALAVSRQAYDKRVAGVISGAGDLRPGILLDRQSKKSDRLPLAMNGKVYCKVDADYGPVEVGDLLTTSLTCGHAMKASDCAKAFGTVIGKALRRLEAGKGLIPILVALQ